jgi:hypothetical protein
MGMSEGYRRIAEQQREKWKSFNRRLIDAGLPEAQRPDFDDEFGGQYGDVKPRTRSGWAIYVALREKEGGLASEEKDDVKYGLERILISEKQQEIRKRLEAGGTLPDPRWPDTSPAIPAETALSHRATSIVHWAAVKELGLEKDEHYGSVYRSARDEMYDISRQRGDMEQLFESSRPVYGLSSAAAQELQPPSDFCKIEVFIPLDALKQQNPTLEFVRYHPRHGLVRGWISEQSYYDRGAGSYPGSRGARVKEFWTSVGLLLADVNFRKCKGMPKHSVWRVHGTPAVILGRDKSTRSVEAELRFAKRFDNAEDAKGFLTGSIESGYVRETLPVLVGRSGSGYQLRFSARPLEK